MKAHVSVSAVSVLCLVGALFGRLAAAQIPAAPAEVPSVAAPAAPPVAAQPAPPPPTPVDTPPSTAVHSAAPAPAAAPAAAPAPGPAVALSSTPAEPAPAPAADGERALSAPRQRDAHNDRLLFAPTAETNPRGSFYATSYEIVLLQIGYALTDSTQLSLTLTPPLGDEHVIPGDISIKTVLLREPHVSLAGIVSASGIVGFEEFSGFLGRVGAVASFCPDASQCRLAFSMSSDIALAGPASLLFSGGGVSYRAGRIVSLIAELDTLIPLAEAVGEANGLLGGAGVRLSGPAWGVDLALMKAGKAGSTPSGFFPFIAATYRYVP